MQARCLVAVVLVLACGGAGAVVATAAPYRPGIVGGAPTDGDLPVVAILDQDGTPFCTGTAIGPRTVLTAAHCVAGTRVADRIFVGADVAAPGIEVAVAWVEAHPAYDPATLQADVGLIRLAGDVDADTLPFSRAPLSEAWIGRELRFVGFGHERSAPPGGAGTKRHVTQPILELGDADFVYDEATCHGDSGGPALARDGEEEVVVGVVSSGAPGCRHYGRAARVDVHAGWIDERLHAAEPPGGCATSAARSRSGAGWPVLLALAALRRPSRSPRPPRSPAPRRAPASSGCGGCRRRCAPAPCGRPRRGGTARAS